MAFETTPARQAIRDKLVNLFHEVPVQGTISHAAITKAIGVRTTSPDALKHAAFKIAAEEHGIAFENIRGVGYRRLAAGDISRVGSYIRCGIKRKAKRGNRKIVAVMSANPNNMSNGEKMRAYTEIGLLGMIQAAAGRSAANRAYKAAESEDERSGAPPSHGEIAIAVLSALTTKRAA